jgi:hypothetical protein
MARAHLFFDGRQDSLAATKPPILQADSAVGLPRNPAWPRDPLPIPGAGAGSPAQRMGTWGPFGACLAIFA